MVNFLFILNTLIYSQDVAGAREPTGDLFSIPLIYFIGSASLENTRWGSILNTPDILPCTRAPTSSTLGIYSQYP